MNRTKAMEEVRDLHKKNRKLIREVMGEEDRETMISMYREIRNNTDRISELNEFIRTHP